MHIFTNTSFLLILSLALLALVFYLRAGAVRRRLRLEKEARERRIASAARYSRKEPATDKDDTARNTDPAQSAAGLHDVDGLTGKVAIVTGGGTGLGRSIALGLAARGAKVVIASRKMEHLNATAGEIEELGGEVMTFQLDVRDPAKVDEMVQTTLERFGKIDMLVNNAAGNFVVPASKLTTNGWKAVIDIVLNGTWYCTSAVGKHMIERGEGSILNIVANYAWSGFPGVVHSAAAKAGVLSMTRTLAVEWGYKGLRVNAFAPGTMPSEGASGNLKFAENWAREKIRKGVPLQRLTDADEMADLAIFLLSARAAYINGEVLTADGGAWLPRGMLDLQSL